MFGRRRNPVGITSTQPAYVPYLVTSLTAGQQLTSKGGVLHSIVIGTKGVSSNVLDVYDGTDTSGKHIGTFDTTANVASIVLDAQIAVGIFYVLATGTAAKITFMVSG